MKLNENERINEINENLRLVENKDSLTFGTDAYLLSAFLPNKPSKKAVELGCGSGVVSLLALSHKKADHVYGIEVQSEIADIAKRNSELNSYEGKFKVISKDLRDVSTEDTDGEVDFIFSNPPYMKADSGKLNQNKHKNISRHEIFGDIGDFCACAKKLLKHGGDFYVVYRPDRLADLIHALKSNNLEPKRLSFIHANSNTPPSLLLICAKLGGKSGMVVDKPIYIYKDGTTEYTDEFSRIYEACQIDKDRSLK
ncbi:MAG: methyltransferase [Clostridia bacterium]|nr:methyltransferase [Clostridia bacterium]